MFAVFQEFDICSKLQSRTAAKWEARQFAMLFPVLCLLLGLQLPQHVETKDADSNEAEVSIPQKCALALKNQGFAAPNYSVYAGYIGYGFDYLLGKKTFPVFELSYKKCHVQNNFIILDYVQPTDGHGLKKDKVSTVMRDATDFEGSIGLDYGMSAEVPMSGFTCSGALSASFHLAVKVFIEKNSVMTRNSMSYTAFSLAVENNPGIGGEFKGHLQLIRDAGDSPLAIYMAQLLVHDYGTHVIVKEDAGSTVFIDTFYELSDKHGGGDLSGHVGMGGDIGVDNTFEAHSNMSANVSGHLNITSHAKKTSSKITSIGGPDLVNLEEPFADAHIADHVVSLKQEGKDLATIINAGNLPDWENQDILRVQKLVMDAIQKYGEQNAHRGCRDVSATNFDAKANSDSECHYNYSSYSIGGVYEKCINVKGCNGSRNEHTGNFSCPTGYHDVLYYTDAAQGLQYYWCRGPLVPDFPPKHGLAFGGVNSFILENLNVPTNSTPTTEPTKKSQNVTKTNMEVNSRDGTFLVKCPDGFDHTMAFGGSVYYCFTTNTMQFGIAGIPFGGFMSCQNQFTCPDGFTKVLMHKIEQCAISACIKFTREMNRAVVRRATPAKYVGMPVMKYDEAYGYKKAITYSAAPSNAPIAFVTLIATFLVYAW